MDSRFNNEIYSLIEATSESNQCLNCKNPLCVKGCPIHNDIPGFINQIKENNLEKAREILDRTSGFGDICSYVCYSEDQCMAKCIKGLKGKPVNIKGLERFICDNTSPNIKPISKNEKKLCVIGSGPAGLKFSYEALKNGYNVDIYDKHSELGGLINHAIPSFRLPQSQIKKIEETLLSMGLKFYSKEINDISKLPSYDAYFIATGTDFSYNMNIPGEKLENIIDWSELLSSPDNYNFLKNKKVCVVGGGNVAIDCARTLKRITSDVSIIYRRTTQEMPCNKKELEDALKEDVQIIELRNPKKIVFDDGLQVTLSIMELSDLDSSGRRSVIATPKEELFKCDYLIRAIGSKFDNIFNLEMENGKVKVDDNYQTSIPNVYIIGDAYNGATTVVEAISHANKVFHLYNQNN